MRDALGGEGALQATTAAVAVLEVTAKSLRAILEGLCVLVANAGAELVYHPRQVREGLRAF
jgi:hypothetical protein